MARILVREGSSLFWCSGSLMNNTSLDGTPYFLTANHCGESSSADDYSQWVFYFNYESADCEMPANEPAHQTLTGASLIAHSEGSTNSGSDFKLLLLDDEIPATYSVFFNGWDWTGIPSPTGVTIHHPEGDLKMISVYDEYLVSSQYLGTSQDESGKYWKVFWVETESGFGVTEGGSSGSPIFSQEGYVLGSLAGGKASCTAPFQPDYYGKISYSWKSNGTTPERQLRPWLDPINTGQQKLRGIYFDSTGIFADFEASTTHIKVGGLISYNNLTEGEATGYEWYFEGGEPETSEIISPSYIEYNSAGDYDVRLVAKSLKSSDTITRKEYIHVKPTITPNPSRGKFKISFGSGLPQELDIRVTDMQHRNINFFYDVNQFENSISIDLSIHASGIYLIKIIADGSEEVLKAFLLKHAE
ncbi:MAG: T9SS type A sorting domain-containing protein [bacterium]